MELNTATAIIEEEGRELTSFGVTQIVYEVLLGKHICKFWTIMKHLDKFLLWQSNTIYEPTQKRIVDKNGIYCGRWKYFRNRSYLLQTLSFLQDHYILFGYPLYSSQQQCKKHQQLELHQPREFSVQLTMKIIHKSNPMRNITGVQ